MMRLPDSKAVSYTLAGASIVCAILLTALYATGGQLYPNLVLPGAGGGTMLTLEPASITAKAAIVYDPTTKKVLFDKNADASLPLASLTKLMTATAVLAEMNEDTPVTITPEDLKPDGDWGFKPGEVWSLHDLLTFGLGRFLQRRDGRSSQCGAKQHHHRNEHGGGEARPYQNIL